MLIAAADYPLLDVFWTILIFFTWVAWIWTLFMVLTDVFRRHDLSGFGKAAWTIGVIVLPFLGVLIYLVSQGSKMAQRSADEHQAAKSDFDAYVRTVAASDGPAGQIEKAKGLLDDGTITVAEYDSIKAKALA